jgi:hypothetical protein
MTPLKRTRQDEYVHPPARRDEAEATAPFCPLVLPGGVPPYFEESARGPGEGNGEGT